MSLLEEELRRNKNYIFTTELPGPDIGFSLFVALWGDNRLYVCGTGGEYG